MVIRAYRLVSCNASALDAGSHTVKVQALSAHRFAMGEGIRTTRGFPQGGLGPVARLAPRVITTMDALNQADKVQTYTRQLL